MRTAVPPRSPFLLILLALLLSAASAVAQIVIVPDVVTYLGVSSTTHQTQFNTLSGQGYRPISLSVAGTRSNPNYTAVWIRRSGAGYTAIHGVDRAAYEAWALTQRNAGLRPYLVTAAGPTGNDVYAGVYMADGVNAVEDTGLYSFTTKNQWARDNSYVQTCAGYAASVYCGVWEETADRVYSSYWNSTGANFSADFNAHASAHQRQSFVLQGASGWFNEFGQIWRDDVIGAWECIPDLTLAQMQSEISTRRPSGQYPICLQQYSTGTSARFSAIFAYRDRVQARVLTRTGLTSSYFAGFDQYMEDHVRAHGIRASSIAITKHGRLVHARGFTLAEPGATPTEPDSMYRIASCSKVVTGLMTNLLVQRGGTITRSTRIANYLGLTSPNADFYLATVQHGLQHQTGAGDFASSTIAHFLNPTSPTLPQPSWSNALFIAGNPLAFTPGTQSSYTNGGYYLLGEVIERAAGKSYERFLREDLGAPLDVTRLWVSDSLVTLRKPGEVDYHNRELDITPSEMHTDRRVMPIQYGGNGDDNLTRRAAAGGVVTSPVDYVRILAGALDLGRDGGIFTQSTIDTMLAAPTMGTTTLCGFDHRVVRPNGVVAYDKDGQLWGSSGKVIYRSDGVAIAVFDNLANSVASTATLNDLADAVTFWPSYDLFPNFGLPSFTRTSPRIDAVDRTTLPNVTDNFLTIDGELLANVDRVTLTSTNGTTSVTSLLSTTWADGWLRRVSDRQLELHIPQGMIPGSYDVVLRAGLVASRSFPLSITRATTRTLGGPASSFIGFDLVCSRGASPSTSLLYLGFSTSNLPTVVPGIVSLGIGNNFTSLGIAGPASFNPLTGAVRIAVPDLGASLYHFQAAILDPTSINAFPMPVSNVRSVQGL